MARKPNTAAQYRAESADLAYSTSLYVATILGDLLDDVVIIGGLVPSLIIPQGALDGKQAHAGTMDVDLGLAITIFNQKRYQEICKRLKNAEFKPSVNEKGNCTSQTWQVEANGRIISVDFLIPPTRSDDIGGRLRNLEAGFSAIITPGLQTAFRDYQSIQLRGMTIRGEQAQRNVNVCGPGAFVVLKALAFDGRGENKDAYDLVYLLQNYGSDVADVADRMRHLLDDESSQQALAILERDFLSTDSVGIRRLAVFLGDEENEVVRADAAGSVRALLAYLG